MSLMYFVCLYKLTLRSLLLQQKTHFKSSSTVLKYVKQLKSTYFFTNQYTNMEAQKEYANVTSLIISVILSWITYQYFMDGNYILFLQAVLVGIAFIGVNLLYFILVRYMIHLIKHGYIYSNFIFITSIVFISIVLISLFFYAAFCLVPFAAMADYIHLLRYYFIKIIPFIAICSIVTGVGLALFFYEVEIEIKKKLRRYNIFYLVAVFLLIISVFFIFYTSNKIEQPKLNKEYSHYKDLTETITSKKYEIKLLIDGEKDEFYGNLSRPYFLLNKKEVIINAIASREEENNEPIKFARIYKINKYGKIIDTINNRMDESNINYVRFPSGYISNFDSTMIVTWIFDGNKTNQNYTDVKPQKDWKINVISEDTKTLKKVRFFKRFKNKNNIDDGTNYYNINLENDTLKFKIDSLYSDRNQKEKRILFYRCDAADFNLLFNGSNYYIIKRR